MVRDIKRLIIAKTREALNGGHREYALRLSKYLVSRYSDDAEMKVLFFKAVQDTNEDTPILNKIKAFFLKTKAYFLIKRGEIRPAMELLETVVELNPQDMQALLEIIEFIAQEDPNTGIKLLQTINIEAVHNIYILKRIAQIMLNARNLTEAKRILKKILIQNPNDIEVQKMLKNIEAIGVLEKDFSIRR